MRTRDDSIGRIERVKESHTSLISFISTPGDLAAWTYVFSLRLLVATDADPSQPRSDQRRLPFALGPMSLSESRLIPVSEAHQGWWSNSRDSI